MHQSDGGTASLELGGGDRATSVGADDGAVALQVFDGFGLTGDLSFDQPAKTIEAGGCHSRRGHLQLFLEGFRKSCRSRS